MELPHRTAAALLLTIALLSSPCLVNCVENAVLKISTHDTIVIVSESVHFKITIDGIIMNPVNVTLHASNDGMVGLQPAFIEMGPKAISYTNVTIVGVSPGHVDITAIATPNNTIDVSNVFIRVVVAISPDLISISSVIGWIYFVAWSVSFYPQIYINYKRKSVVGLNFDFLALNIVGFLLYGIFNIGLYSIPEVQKEYAHRFPRGLNPVHLNDVFFAFHAAIASFITIIQCFCYERADQRVSNFARSLLGFYTILGIISVILSTVNVIAWLDFLYICSYIKLSITLIKYVPQAYMNYKRKSTIGWSIGNVLLDFTGGSLSMLQMIINAYNYDDWASIFGDPTKFGLGLFSVMFDIFFVLQHYVFYRNLDPYMEIEGDNNNEATESQEENDIIS